MHLPKDSISPLVRLCFGKVEFSRAEILGALSDVSIYPEAANLIFDQIKSGAGQLVQVSDDEQGIVDAQVEDSDRVLFPFEEAKFTFLADITSERTAPVLDITCGESKKEKRNSRRNN